VPTRHTDIHDCSRSIGELIDTEVSWQLLHVCLRQWYPGFVETDGHGMYFLNGFPCAKLARQ
jgi:hypothetical protein